MPSQPVGEMLEVALLRLLVAGLIGVDSNGVPNFTYPNFGGSGGGGIPITPPTVTPNFFASTAGQTVIIPIGAVNASVVILTGTGTLNGVNLPVGLPWSEPNKIAATVTLILGSPGTAQVYYGT